MAFSCIAGYSVILDPRRFLAMKTMRNKIKKGLPLSKLTIFENIMELRV